MPRQTTATLLVGPTAPEDFYGNPLRARHLLTLTTNSRATWTVHSLVPDQRPAVPVLFDAESPEHLLAQGMLAFLWVVVPESLVDRDDLQSLVTPTERHFGVIVPLPVQQADDVARIFGEWAQAVVTTLDSCCVTRAQIRAAQTAGVALRVAAATRTEEPA
ncbi:hypothetical protein ACI79C_03130 [Geodermatophilus sp. SYSU D00697]